MAAGSHRLQATSANAKIASQWTNHSRLVEQRTGHRRREQSPGCRPTLEHTNLPSAGGQVLDPQALHALPREHTETPHTIPRPPCGQDVIRCYSLRRTHYTGTSPRVLCGQAVNICHSLKGRARDTGANHSCPEELTALPSAAQIACNNLPQG